MLVPNPNKAFQSPGTQMAGLLVVMVGSLAWSNPGCAAPLPHDSAISGPTDGGDEGVFIGDVMHHPIQVYRPEWSSRFCTDPREAEASRRRVLEQCADCNARVFPAHFGAPHLGWVRRKGTGYRFEFDHGEQI